MLYNPIFEFENVKKLLDSVAEAGRFFTNRAGDYELANLYENDTGYMIQFVAPGVKKEDISIDFSNNVLAIGVKREKAAPAAEGAALLREERSAYSFTKSYRLSDDADIDRIDAKLQDGVLLVSIPKKENAKPKKITVQVH